jgi:N-acetyl sugar amidotransferase
MKYCTRCVLPETHDTIIFDEEGVCSVCRQIDYRDGQIDWDERRKMLDDLIVQYKDKGEYDCIIPFSGGKDSTFQLWYAVKELELKPLVVRFDHWGYRPLVSENNTRTFKILGVDVLTFQPSWHAVRELMLESLKRRGDFCWHCHTGVYAHTMQIALKYNTPLIIWGESLAEYASWYSYDEFEEVDEKRFNRAMNQGMTADDMYEFLGGRVSKRDLYSFAYPPRKELMRIKCCSICLGNYIKWDTRKQVEIIKNKLGWKGQPIEGIPHEYWDYEKIECSFQGVRDYCKYIKRGYGRVEHLAGIDIRNKRMSREEAWEISQKYLGVSPASLNRFLDFLQITEEEFLDILSQHLVHPWKFDPSRVKPGEPLDDMDQWDKTFVDEPKVGPQGTQKAKSIRYL